MESFRTDQATRAFILVFMLAAVPAVASERIPIYKCLDGAHLWYSSQSCAKTAPGSKSIGVLMIDPENITSIGHVLHEKANPGLPSSGPDDPFDRQIEEAVRNGGTRPTIKTHDPHGRLWQAIASWSKNAWNRLTERFIPSFKRQATNA